MKKEKIQRLTLTSVMAALITVLTVFVKINIASSNGYIHFGDGLVYLSGCILGGYGIFASALGGALADIFSGFPLWALPTAIIKGLNCVPFIIATRLYKKSTSVINAATVISAVFSSFITVGGYFAAEVVLYSEEAAFLDIPGNAVQGLASTVIFILLGLATDRIKKRKS